MRSDWPHSLSSLPTESEWPLFLEINLHTDALIVDSKTDTQEETQIYSNQEALILSTKGGLWPLAKFREEDPAST